jgi:CRISPR-associated endonuclease Cas1
MHAQATPASGPTCIAHGFGLKIYVERGHLIVDDGICDERQTRRYNRATGKLQRLVVLGQSGYVTLDALSWLRDVGATFVQIDNHGRLVSVSAKPGTDRPAVRRAQALAAERPAGIELARWALAEKLRGQSAVLTGLPHAESATNMVARMLAELGAARSLDAILAAEAQAAAAYWDAWSTLPVRFAPTARVPDHWRSFGQRHSTLTASPRQAINPANALLNFLYTLIEAETTLACHVVGLDPGLGVFHRDRQGRSSLALDLMEPLRPIADAYVLALLTKRVLTGKQFIETRRGNCRILPDLTRQLGQTIQRWAAHAAPTVEAGARILATTGHKPVKQPTPLTNTNRRTARGGHKAPAVQAAAIELPYTCRDCGAQLPDRRRRYCQPCNKARFNQTGPDARATAAAVLKQLRQEGQDPAHGGRAGQIRGEKNAAHQRAVREWLGGRPDPATFQVEILPGIREVQIDVLVGATGLSVHYCSLIRLGKKVPHPRHWSALRHVATGG